MAEPRFTLVRLHWCPQDSRLTCLRKAVGAFAQIAAPYRPPQDGKVGGRQACKDRVQKLNPRTMGLGTWQI